MATVDVGADQLAALAADLRRHSRETPSKTRAVVSKGALNVKQDWQQAWTGLGHAPYLAKAVTYDITMHGLAVEAEIGPDKAKKQGPLGNIIEFGTSNNPPHPGGGPALAREEPRFVSAMETLAAGLLS